MDENGTNSTDHVPVTGCRPDVGKSVPTTGGSVESATASISTERPVCPSRMCLGEDDSDAAAKFLAYPSCIEGGFVNLTNMVVPNAVATLLSFGPKFFPASVPTMAEYYGNDYLTECVTSNHEVPHDILRMHYSYILDEFIKILEKDRVSSVRARTLKEMFSQTKRFLNSHPDVCLVQQGQSERTVLMTTCMYQGKMTDWVSGCLARGVYSLVTSNFPAFLATIEDRFLSLRGRLLAVCDICEDYVAGDRRYVLSKKLYKALVALPALPMDLPYLYGLLDLQQPEHPCRPMVSTANWYSFWLQRALFYILRNVLKGHFQPVTMENVDGSILDLRRMIILDGYEFIKIGIDTNIEEDAILDCLRAVFSRHCPADSSLLLDIIRFCFFEANYFRFGDNIFMQSSGSLQGSCDAGLIATILLDYNLQFYRQLLLERYCIRYWNYVDNFLVYMPSDCVDPFKEDFQKHTSLKLTIERAVPGGDATLSGTFPHERVIPFLDVLVVRIPGKLYFSTYHQSTACQQMIHYLSRDDLNCKRSAAEAFIRRPLSRTSNRSLYNDLCIVEGQLRANSYPDLFVSDVFLSLLNRSLDAIGNERAKLSGKFVSEDAPADRRLVLCRFLERFQRTGISRSRKRGGRQLEGEEEKAINDKSLKYSCVSLAALVGLMCRELMGSDLTFGLPQFSEVEHLISQLNETLAGRSPGGVKAGTRPALIVYMTNCRVCDKIFLITSNGTAVKVSKAVFEDPLTLVYRHKASYSHTVNPRFIELSAGGRLPPAARILLTQGFYKELGADCEVGRVLDFLPGFLITATRDCMEKVHRPGMIVLRVPPPLRARKLDVSSGDAITAESPAVTSDSAAPASDSPAVAVVSPAVTSGSVTEPMVVVALASVDVPVKSEPLACSS